MKILFNVIKAGSGNDTYFQRLSEALRSVDIDSEIIYYPKLFQFFPWLLLFFNKNKDGDIIHTNVEYGWVFLSHNKPLIVTLHHNVFDPSYRKSLSWQQKLFHDVILKPNIRKSLNAATKIIAVSKYTKESFLKTFGKYQIIVIYNFVDTEKYKAENVQSFTNRFALLFVGNLTKRKGADLLPQIMAQLGSDYVLYYTSGLRTKIPESFILNNMIPLGKLSEEKLVAAYNRCDALLFPTRFEGFGYVAAEAMACGKPVIAANSSSIPELVENEKNGYLCAVGDVDDFVEKIQMLKNKMQKGWDFADSNRKKIERNFSIPISMKQYEKVYSI